MLEKILAAIEALTAALNANTAARTGEPAATEAPKKTRAQKAVEAAQAAPQPEPTPAPAAATATAPAVTMEQAIALTKDLAKINRDAAVKTLAKHGAPKATELKPEVLPAYVADVMAQLNPPKADGDGLI